MKRAAGKILFLVVLCALTVNLSGCTALKRKFTRKKKVEKDMPVYYQVKKYYRGKLR